MNQKEIRIPGLRSVAQGLFEFAGFALEVSLEKGRQTREQKPVQQNYVVALLTKDSLGGYCDTGCKTVSFCNVTTSPVITASWVSKG